MNGTHCKWHNEMLTYQYLCFYNKLHTKWRSWEETTRLNQQSFLTFNFAARKELHQCSLDKFGWQVKNHSLHFFDILTYKSYFSSYACRILLHDRYVFSGNLKRTTNNELGANSIKWVFNVYVNFFILLQKYKFSWQYIYFIFFNIYDKKTR